MNSTIVYYIDLLVFCIKQNQNILRSQPLPGCTEMVDCTKTN